MTNESDSFALPSPAFKAALCYDDGIIMQRTTIVLPPSLKQRAGECARGLGLSFGEFVRRAVEKAVCEKAPRRGKNRDPFWDDRAVFRGPLPKDLAARHDFYLYGE